ncbi:hypothetical protein [Varibaculum cambriense]|uniref:Uncharacterized protein n=1 Tax=Varibaculum cambriense TaxID=184870 RepID=A0ABX4UQP4_9ACTO|nr:hypothetical protein [Varibaculum cambriense]PMB89444.1 hypothetical protein CJ240_06660 [Varibaculum cambriense]
MCKDCGVIELAQSLEEAARALVRGEIAVSGQGEVLVAADMARDAAEILQGVADGVFGPLVSVVSPCPTVECLGGVS